MLHVHILLVLVLIKVPTKDKLSFTDNFFESNKNSSRLTRFCSNMLAFVHAPPCNVLRPLPYNALYKNTRQPEKYRFLLRLFLTLCSFGRFLPFLHSLKMKRGETLNIATQLTQRIAITYFEQK